MIAPGLIILLLTLILARPTYAYLDPGTGSYLAQVMIAALLGVGFVFKSKLSIVKTLIMRLFSKSKTQDTPSENKSTKKS